MKSEHEEEHADLPFFSHHKKLRVMEEQLYGHVLAAIDFEALQQLEFQLYSILSAMKLGDKLALDLSVRVLERALHRAVEDPSRFCDFGPPPGVTEAERKAVAFDPACRFCLAERETEALLKRSGDGHEHEDEQCPLCDDLAVGWREEHREVLEKAGLYKPPTEPRKDNSHLWQPWPPKSSNAS